MQNNAEQSLFSQLESSLGEIGCQVRTVDVKHVEQLQAELASQRTARVIRPELESRYLNKLEFTPPADLPDPRFLIVVVAPSPLLVVKVLWKGRSFEALVPPTYRNDTDRLVQNRIDRLLEPAGYRKARALLPQKLLVTRSGLGTYGKNNITYVEGMGSFHRPTVFFTDAQALPDFWDEPRMLERCADCSACQKQCPTGAIRLDRFVLEAERCLTFHNESPQPFPEWVETDWHTCLIGCMACQTSCPENVTYSRRRVAACDFDEAETKAILGQVAWTNLKPATREKIEQLGLGFDYELLPRNLGVLLRRE